MPNAANTAMLSAMGLALLPLLSRSHTARTGFICPDEFTGNGLAYPSFLSEAWVMGGSPHESSLFGAFARHLAQSCYAILALVAETGLALVFG